LDSILFEKGFQDLLNKLFWTVDESSSSSSSSSISSFQFLSSHSSSSNTFLLDTSLPLGKRLVFLIMNMLFVNDPQFISSSTTPELLPPPPRPHDSGGDSNNLPPYSFPIPTSPSSAPPKPKANLLRLTNSLVINKKLLWYPGIGSPIGVNSASLNSNTGDSSGFSIFTNIPPVSVPLILYRSSLLRLILILNSSILYGKSQGFILCL
jgi:hypothetical protein